MKTIINSILKAVIAAAFVMPMMTSCFDDSKLWDSINKIEHRLDSLENSLNKQFQALNSLIDSKTTVSSCEKNADGSYDVTLSNGMKFTVLPDGTDFSALVSITEVGGKKCWATYDASGSLVVLKDPSGNPVPVIKDEYRRKVEVLVEDGKYYDTVLGGYLKIGSAAVSEQGILFVTDLDGLEDEDGATITVLFQATPSTTTSLSTRMPTRITRLCGSSSSRTWSTTLTLSNSSLNLSI